MIYIERVYGGGEKGKGKRYLVDRLWPRGIKKEALHMDGWLKETAPSSELRKWFGHDPAKWDEFLRRYHAELDAHPEVLDELRTAMKKGDVTLLYGAKDEQHNQAVALKSYLERKPSA
jgi:uncharacterized protein YeaO (DUF488 family)